MPGRNDSGLSKATPESPSKIPVSRMTTAIDVLMQMQECKRPNVLSTGWQASGGRLLGVPIKVCAKPLGRMGISTSGFGRSVGDDEEDKRGDGHTGEDG